MLAGLALVASVATSISSDRPAVRFFPAGVFAERQDIADFVDEWYSQHLAAMDEPSLLLLPQRDRDVTVYRLLWLPTFHHPVGVRIERTGDGARLHSKVLDGRGGYEPGQVAIDRSLPLGDEQWNRFSQLLDEAAIWELPARLEDDGSTDGDQLIIEGVRGGKYHVIGRASPDPVYEALSRYMLELTKIDMRQQWEEYHPGGTSEDSE